MFGFEHDITEAETIEVDIVCRRCTVSRDQFGSIQAAHRAGWREINPWTPTSGSRWNHIATCPVCRDHPEEEEI